MSDRGAAEFVPKIPATGVVLTKNSERTLDATLHSLNFCAELLVVDSGSSDATLQIAERHGARVLHRDWEGYIPQYRWAYAQATMGWVVALDSDEELDESLRDAIITALADPGDCAGFYCNRLSWYLDRFIRHSGWHPDWLLRVFRRDALDFPDTDLHPEWRTEGPTRRLQGHILHYPYADIADHLARINEYTQTMAASAFKRGKRSSTSKAVFRGLGRFLKMYLLKQGFRDGRAGFVLALHGAFYAFQKHLRILELQER